MKSIITLLAVVFSFYQACSQTTLNFCARVDPNGYCLFDNTKFFLSPDSSSAKIYMELIQPHTFSGTSKVTFQVFSVAKNGEEKSEGSTEQNVQGDWIYAWVPHQFNAGKYNVKIFNDKNELMASRSLELFN